MLTHADVCTASCASIYWPSAMCWRMLTYADVCWRMLTYADVCWRMLTYADVCTASCASIYWPSADVCWRMLKYADVCWRMMTYAGICWRMLVNSELRFNLLAVCRNQREHFKKHLAQVVYIWVYGYICRYRSLFCWNIVWFCSMQHHITIKLIRKILKFYKNVEVM